MSNLDPRGPTCEQCGDFREVHTEEHTFVAGWFMDGPPVMDAAAPDAPAPQDKEGEA